MLIICNPRTINYNFHGNSSRSNLRHVRYRKGRAAHFKRQVTIVLYSADCSDGADVSCLIAACLTVDCHRR
ncbi:hypothetical protein PUN28_012635 [Cardiocondyla obscurior]|uniref:Uncharacterized protein n=1 Tax=Cardiocondyla obscurior TaxID=286306 RepID=A0AAW2FHS9_9HYME